MIDTYGQKGIGETVRVILKASMTDELMASYNRTGIRGRTRFPESFEKCIICKLKTEQFDY